jgi:hypothetical protein
MGETAASDTVTEESTMTATVTATPHLHELPDQREAAQMAKERKAEAKRHFSAIKKAADDESTSSMLIGWHAYMLKKEGLFGMLGFDSEDAARKAAGVGRSTWYSTIRLAEAFQGLEETTYVSMKLANAQALSDLPESKRLSREWVRMAGSMSIEDFQAKVDEVMEGKAKASDGKERGVVLKMPIPASAKDVIQSGLEEYAESIGIPKADTGKALELLVVEKSGQPSLIEAITNAIQLIKAAKKFEKENLSADELVKKLYDTMGEMALMFKKALDAAKNGNGIQN